MTLIKMIQAEFKADRLLYAARYAYKMARDCNRYDREMIEVFDWILQCVTYQNSRDWAYPVYAYQEAETHLRSIRGNLLCHND